MINNPFSLIGKSILVTGASSGIGRSIAIECSKMGAHLIITGRNGERLNKTFVSLSGEGHKQMVADLSDEGQIKDIVDKIDALDGVVHCAGIVKTLPFKFVNSSALSDVMAVNFTAPTLLSAQLVKVKKVNKGGSIVFISSISGSSTTRPSSSIYSASKNALNGIARGMAIDLAPQKIRVNCILPGMIETDFLNSGIITTEQLEYDRGTYPLGRYGQPSEVAYAAIYLLSDATAWVTGSNLTIDGGLSL